MLCKISRARGALVAGLAVWLGIGPVSQARALNLEAATPTTNKLTFGGDFRLRHESFWEKTRGQVDRHRERMRLRFGVKAEMEKWDVALRLASGTGEQTSTNQTFHNSFNQKSINIDQAFATYKPASWVKLHGGRMNNPFWRTYGSDLVWDSDINPEGLAEQGTYDVNEMVSVFGNFAQLPLYENSSSKKDPWMFGNQVGVNTKLGGGVRWSFALANYAVSHELVSVLVSTSSESNDPKTDQPVIQGDNRRLVGGSQLAGQYHMIHLNTEVGFQVGLPVRIQADYVKNIHQERTNNQNKGYQVGFIVNSAKTAGSWEFAYFNKYIEANATLSDLSDSDWGPNGGTNRKGHIIWLAYCPTDFLTLQGKYFLSRRVDPMLATSGTFGPGASPSYRDTNRFQLDAIVKF